MSLRKTLLGVAFLLGLASIPANAATYNWSFATGSPSTSGSGLLTTDVDIGPANVLTMSGTYGGVAILNLVAPGTFPTVAPNDNIINSLTDPELNFGGLSALLASGSYLNIFYNGTSDEACTNTSILGCSNNAFGRFSLAVAPVPLPAALPMLSVGLASLVAMGAVRRRRRPSKII